MTPTYEYNPDTIPKVYRKVEIEYSKFGVEDFDFGFYNRTPFSGLETHILNSYTNPLVQVMHYRTLCCQYYELRILLKLSLDLS